ncbi:MAG: hypothetical protein HYR56_32975 [Acidobacteria bacterium]|nr:hypothetical protein [Acidobacteriota bacterium]MBI3422094.1 hypothetical protein [Acidobacteriota bacterium]
MPQFTRQRSNQRGTALSAGLDVAVSAPLVEGKVHFKMKVTPLVPSKRTVPFALTSAVKKIVSSENSPKFPGVFCTTLCILQEIGGGIVPVLPRLFPHPHSVFRLADRKDLHAKPSPVIVFTAKDIEGG